MPPQPEPECSPSAPPWTGTGTVECVTPMFDRIPTDRRLYDEGYTVVPYIFDGTYVCYALSFTGGAVLKRYRDDLCTL